MPTLPQTLGHYIDLILTDNTSFTQNKYTTTPFVVLIVWIIVKIKESGRIR